MQKSNTLPLCGQEDFAYFPQGLHKHEQVLMPLQIATSAITFDREQLVAAHALYDSYCNSIIQDQPQRQRSLAVLQAAPATLHPHVLELRAPHYAAHVTADMACLSSSMALQVQAYLNLYWTFVMCILTPHQAGMLSAASYPYLVEFPTILWHILHAGAAD